MPILTRRRNWRNATLGKLGVTRNQSKFVAAPGGSRQRVNAAADGSARRQSRKRHWQSRFDHREFIWSKADLPRQALNWTTMRVPVLPFIDGGDYDQFDPMAS